MTINLQNRCKKLTDSGRIPRGTDAAGVHHREFLFGRAAPRGDDGAGVTHTTPFWSRQSRDKAHHGFNHIVPGPARGNFFVFAPDLTDHHHGVRIGIFVKELQNVNML